jgi:hypothetical protein
MKVGLFLLALIGLLGGGFMFFQAIKTVFYVIFSSRIFLAHTSFGTLLGLILRTGLLLAVSLFVVVPISYRMLQESLSD